MATQKTIKTTPQPAAKKAATEQNTVKLDFAFGRENYIIMFAGLVVLFIGYLLMIGGADADPTAYSDRIFNTRRLVIAPITILLGFAIEAYAIMKNPTDKETAQRTE
ncbi:hypothetical protein FACS1894201_00240 [Bacteroidia bacterium]|nr:hypothetical protein FACS1894201_00240 [Bacteroidia bacterium]